MDFLPLATACRCLCCRGAPSNGAEARPAGRGHLIPLLLPLVEPGVANSGLLDPGRVHHPSTAAELSLNCLIDLLPRKLLFLQVDCGVLSVLHQCRRICPSPITYCPPLTNVRMPRGIAIADCRPSRHPRLSTFAGGAVRHAVCFVWGANRYRSEGRRVRASEATRGVMCCTYIKLRDGR